MKDFEHCKTSIAKKYSLGSTLVTGHLAKYWQEASEEYASLRTEQLQEPKWISVKERLPEKWDDYFVCFESGSRTICTFLLPQKRWLWTDDDGEVDESISPVTHWMPLPEPPKI